jgi:hypothetical protein
MRSTHSKLAVFVFELFLYLDKNTYGGLSTIPLHRLERRYTQTWQTVAEVVVDGHVPACTGESGPNT